MGARGRQKPGIYADGQVDPAPDCYAVERHPDHFIVRHYPRADAKKPCCVAKVSAKFEGESDVDILARAAVLCDRKHAAEQAPTEAA